MRGTQPGEGHGRVLVVEGSCPAPPLPSASLHLPSLPHTAHPLGPTPLHTQKPLPLVSPLPPVAPPGVPPLEFCRQEGIEGNTTAQRLQADWKLKEGMQSAPGPGAGVSR